MTNGRGANSGALTSTTPRSCSSSETAFPEPGIYEGLDGMERGFRGSLESWRDLRFELNELIPASDAIVAMYHQTGSGRASGVHTELDGGHVWRMRDGKAVRLEVHSNRAAALEAAGLGRGA